MKLGFTGRKMSLFSWTIKQQLQCGLCSETNSIESKVACNCCYNCQDLSTIADSSLPALPPKNNHFRDTLQFIVFFLHFYFSLLKLSQRGVICLPTCLDVLNNQSIIVVSKDFHCPVKRSSRHHKMMLLNVAYVQFRIRGQFKLYFNAKFCNP